MAFLVTGDEACVRARSGKAAGLVGGQTHATRQFWWVWLKHAALGRFMALDYPGAVSLGHTPLLHWRPLGEGQRAPGAVQQGALQDPGQVGATEAAK